MLSSRLERLSVVWVCFIAHPGESSTFSLNSTVCGPPHDHMFDHIERPSTTKNNQILRVLGHNVAELFALKNENFNESAINSIAVTRRDRAKTQHHLNININSMGIVCRILTLAQTRIRYRRADRHQEENRCPKSLPVPSAGRASPQCRASLYTLYLGCRSARSGRKA